MGVLPHAPYMHGLHVGAPLGIQYLTKKIEGVPSVGFRDGVCVWCMEPSWNAPLETVCLLYLLGCVQLQAPVFLVARSRDGILAL